MIHHISPPPGQFAGDIERRLFTNTLPAEGHPDSQLDFSVAGVGALADLRRDGELVQFVSAGQRAWHAGASAGAAGRPAMISACVELKALGDTPFTDAQYARLGELARTLAAAPADCRDDR